MTTASTDLTRLTVNLVPRAVVALAHAADITGDSRTDTVNRALQTYAVLTEAARAGGGRFVFDDRDGPVKVSVGRPLRWWARMLRRASTTHQ